MIKSILLMVLFSHLKLCHFLENDVIKDQTFVKEILQKTNMMECETCKPEKLLLIKIIFQR